MPGFDASCAANAIPAQGGDLGARRLRTGVMDVLGLIIRGLHVTWW